MTEGNPTTHSAADPPASPSAPRRGLVAVLTRMFSSLRNRNYRLFFIGHLTSTIGRWAQAVAMSWLVWEITASEAWSGAIRSAAMLPMTFLAAAGGLAAERFDRRRILLVTQYAAAVGPFVLAVLLLFDPELAAFGIWPLLVVALVHGVVHSFDMPARQAFVVEMVGREDLPNAIALNSSLFNASRAVGSALGSLLLYAFGAAVCFFADSLTYMALVAGLMMMRLPPPDKARQRRSRSSKHPFGGLVYCWNHRPIRAAMVLLAAASILGWSVQVLLPSFAQKTFGMGKGLFGAFYSVYGLGAVTGALVMAYLGSYRKRERLILVGVTLFIASTVAFTVVPNCAAALVALYFGGMGMQLCMAGINSYIQMLVSERFRGRVMGVYGMLFGGMFPLGALATGFTGQLFSSPVAVQINMVLLALVTVCVALYWRRLRHHHPAAES